MNKKGTQILTFLLVLFVFCWFMIENARANKVGVGPFVMAVSYTESYDDLQYVANFVNCEQAQAYYDSNCIGAYIMMCQLEEYLYMPIGHKSDSSFDFEPTEGRSCGFVGVDPKFTGVE